MSVSYASQRLMDTSSVHFEYWTRPTDWLSLGTEPVQGDQKIIMLYSIQNTDNNWFTISCAGAYTVDWGDGTTTNTATGVTTSKVLSWASYSGATLTSRGYRQAIITVTPQAGQTLTSVNFGIKHATPAAGYCSGLLEVVMAGSSVSAVAMTGVSMTNNRLERFRYVGTNVITSWLNMFASCAGLRTTAATNGQGYDLWANSATSFSGTFNACYSLDTGPVFGGNTGSVTTCLNMFANCVSMRAVSSFNTAAVTTAATMFNGCGSLTNIPAFDWSACITFNTFAGLCGALTSVTQPTNVTSSNNDMTSAFSGCVSLNAVPDFDFSKTTTLATTFNGCKSLTDTTNLNSLTNLCTSMVGTFTGCVSLGAVTAISTHGVTNFTSCFSGCTSLTTFPTLTGNTWKTSASTNFSSMFLTCLCLSTAPFLDTSAGTVFTSMFSGCTALRTVPALVVSSGTVFTTMFATCSSLESAPLSGGRYSISYASCSLSPSALDAIYTALGTAQVGQSITVTANFGIASDTPGIANGKAWTVTGS